MLDFVDRVDDLPPGIIQDDQIIEAFFNDHIDVFVDSRADNSSAMVFPKITKIRSSAYKRDPQRSSRNNHRFINPFN